MKYMLADGPQYSAPPAALSAPQVMSTVFLVLCSAFFAVMVIYALRQTIRKRYLLLACLVGGLACSNLEPYLDYIGHLWFAEDNVAIALTTMGRYVPLYVLMGYAFFFGAQSYIAFRAISAGKSARFFVGMYVIEWFFDFALQATGASFGLYEYYGNHPYLFFGAPGWWFSIDSLLGILAGTVFFALRKHLRGKGTLLAIPLIPGLYAGVNGAAGWPVFLSMNSNFDPVVNGNGSDLWVWAAGSLTILLALFYLRLVIGWIRKLQGEAGLVDVMVSVPPAARVQDTTAATP